jgi:hypothetical protein
MPVLVMTRVPDQRVHQRGEHAEAVGARPGERVDGVFRVRHEPGDAPVGRADAGDIAQAAVRIAAVVPEQHPILGL